MIAHLGSSPSIPAANLINNNSEQRKFHFFNYANTALQSMNISLPQIIHWSPSILPPEQLKIKIDFTLLQNFGKNQHSDVIKRAYQELIHNYQNCVKIFTDGSKNGSFVGCAVLSDKFDAICYSLPSFYSILSAELFAIKLAVQQTSSMQNKSLILTDSASALHCLLDPHHHSQHPLAKEIISHLTSFPIGQVTLAWIPGHKCIDGNESVDKMAKEAASLQPVPNIPVHSVDFKTVVKNQLYLEWSNNWNCINTSNKLRSIKPSAKFWSTSYQINRQEETVLCKMRIGHSKLTHAYLLEKKTSSFMYSMFCSNHNPAHISRLSEISRIEK